MKTYFIKVIHDSHKRGYNRTIEVYTQNKDKTFSCIAEDSEINTASYRGDYAVACRLLHEVYGYQWHKQDKYYSLKSKNINLVFLP